MRCRIWSCLAVLMLAAPALAQTAPGGAAQPAASLPASSNSAPGYPMDLSSPRATLLSVYGALRAGDLDAAKTGLLFPDAVHAERFDVINAQLYEPLKLVRAMESRFGPAARDSTACAPLERGLDAALVKCLTIEIRIDGNSAAVVDRKAAINPSGENELTGITFKKQGDSWKIVAATFGDTGDGGEMSAEELGLMRGMKEVVTAACQATMARLHNGAFKTADEAFADYQARVRAGMQAVQAAGAATRK